MRKMRDNIIRKIVFMKWLVVVLFSFTGCALDVNVHTDPVLVRHGIDISNFLPYFEAGCKLELGPDATQEQIDACIVKKVNNFWDELEKFLNTPK